MYFFLNFFGFDQNYFILGYHFHKHIFLNLTFSILEHPYWQWYIDFSKIDIPRCIVWHMINDWARVRRRQITTNVCINICFTSKCTKLEKSFDRGWTFTQEDVWKQFGHGKLSIKLILCTAVKGYFNPRVNIWNIGVVLLII